MTSQPRPHRRQTTMVLPGPRISPWITVSLLAVAIVAFTVIRPFPVTVVTNTWKRRATVQESLFTAICPVQTHETDPRGLILAYPSPCPRPLATHYRFEVIHQYQVPAPASDSLTGIPLSR